MKTNEQRSLPEREIDAAAEYVEIVRSYDLSATLFLTGKCFEYDRIDDLIGYENIEVGGHTWNALRPGLLHDVFGKLFESKYGPAVYQRRDIRRTLHTIEAITSSPVRSWRTHSYASDKTTYELLADRGIEAVSDHTSPDAATPHRDSNGIWHFPVNVPPDHSHIVHGSVTPAEHDRIGWAGTAFGTALYDSDEWFCRVRRRIAEADESDVTTILAHPGCQKLIDDFDTFETLCSFLSEFRTETVSRAVERFQ